MAELSHMIQQSIIQIPEQKNSSLLEIFIHLDQKGVVICRIFIKDGQKIALGQKGTITVPTARQFIICLRSLGIGKTGECI